MLTPTLYLYALWWSQLSNGAVFVINSTLSYLLPFVTVSLALGQLKHELLQAQTIHAGSNRDQGKWPKILKVSLVVIIVATATLLWNALQVIKQFFSATFYIKKFFLSSMNFDWENLHFNFNLRDQRVL